MILYHGSNQIIKNPNISFSQLYLDFGKGFYTTTFIEQARKWALRQALRYGKTPTLNIYKFTNSTNLKILSFQNEDEKCLDFICACRRGEEINNKYDLIIGNVADDDVFKTIDMYFKGFWDKKKTIEELRYYKMNNQYCFVNQTVINNNLLFLNAESLETNL